MEVKTSTKIEISKNHISYTGASFITHNEIMRHVRRQSNTVLVIFNAIPYAL